MTTFHDASPSHPLAPQPALPSEADRTMTVYFDGSCPLCRREIGVYRGLSASQPVCFADVCDPAQPPPSGISRETLMSRFHVQHADGQVVSGARAFLALWAVMPGWRWLARVGALPGVTSVLEWSYRGFLRVRPSLQRLVASLERTASRSEMAAFPESLQRELRTDHAGETGAVMIYRGVLAVARDPALREFAQHHITTEQRHLALIEAVVPPSGRSRLLPLWRLSGWLTGALPACFGPRAVYATIQAVETFVDDHYADQVALIDALLDPAVKGSTSSEVFDPAAEDRLTAMRAVLEECRLDEVAHREDAAGRWDGTAGAVLKLWGRLVSAGSETAVRLCRRL